MTIKELLAQRYKIIAEWPNTAYNVGDIIHLQSAPLPKAMKEMCEKYPHLFRKLEWWEERKVGDMPEYVRVESGHVHRAKWYAGEETESGLQPMRFDINNEKGRMWQVIPNIMCFYTPATETEYLTYINDKQ